MGIEENPAFLTEQLITYIGNKRSLLYFIGAAVDSVRRRIGKKRLNIFDLFAGSGVVARYFKQYSDLLIVNDLERYCEVTNQCYLANRNSLDSKLIESAYREISDRLKHGPLRGGIISNYYSPADDSSIQRGERAFYTNRNAKYIDTARLLIETVPKEYRQFFLGPLLSEASIHANTSGVFKGFYKDSETGIGKFGGRNGDALVRIKGDINLPFPIFSNFESDVQVHREDANDLIFDLDELDLAYLDPPYNQHPYGSNYFMLNVIVDYDSPENISKVSGIPDNWNRSRFNKPQMAHNAFRELIARLRAKFLLVSFNSEGFISHKEMVELLTEYGDVQVLETKYNTFRGSRNLRNRSIHVKEFLFLVERR